MNQVKPDVNEKLLKDLQQYNKEQDRKIQWLMNEIDKLKKEAQRHHIEIIRLKTEVSKFKSIINANKRS